MKQQLRIIGGRFRGKKIAFPEAKGLRPTPDRVRETLFNWLMHRISGSHCLDLFAGSGALGFEACSRGAENVTLIEKNPDVFQSLTRTMAEIKSDSLSVKKMDGMEYLAQCREAFDIIFLDPPFAKGWIEKCVTLIANGNTLKPGGLLYVESESPIQLDTKQWLELKSKKAGMVYYALFERLDESGWQ